MMIDLREVKHQDISKYENAIFDILANNMSIIAPSDNNRGQDFLIWSQTIKGRLRKNECQLFIFICDEQVIGYLQYSIHEKTLLIEEIEITPDYQIKYNILGRVFKLLPMNISSDVVYIESYANKQNKKSNKLLNRLGFEVIGTNKSGKSYLYRGYYSDLIKRYSKECEKEI